MASLSDIAIAIADALTPLQDEIENLQVEPELVVDLTPPAIDIYPADPFHDEGDLEAFGDDRVSHWIVRARVGSVDASGQQAVLLSLMEAQGPTSVKALLTLDQTLSGVVETLDVDGPTGFRLSDGGPLIQVTWNVEIHNTETEFS